MRSKPLVVLVVVLVLSLFGTACSSDGGSGDSATASSAPATTASTAPTAVAVDTTAAANVATTAASTASTTAATEPPTESSPPAPDPTTTPTDSAAPSTDAERAMDGVLTVPEEFATIQEAVDAAESGELVLISPGVYEESVDITTDDLTIRGVDRNTTILDGGFELENGIRAIGVNGVAVENLTARNYQRNGFFFTDVVGYRGSYLTAYRNGDYGIYAYASVFGQLDNSYASGSPDAGFYIGECFPCDAVIDNVVSEFNGLGYSGTNAGGNLFIVNSTWRFNRAGIVPNTGSYELCYPQRDATIVGNIVHSNNNGDTPAIDVAILAMGNGILSAGGVGNLIARNLVYDHDKTGIGLVPYPEDAPIDKEPPESEYGRTCDEARQDPAPDPSLLPATILWDSKQNRVVENVLEDNRDGDLVVASVGTDVSSLGNCWDQNVYATTFPTNIEQLAPCGGTGSGDWALGTYNVAAWLAEEHPPSADYRTATPVPPDQENMPDAETAPARPATDVPYAVDIDAIEVPAKPTV